MLTRVCTCVRVCVTVRARLGIIFLHGCLSGFLPLFFSTVGTKAICLLCLYSPRNSTSSSHGHTVTAGTSTARNRKMAGATSAAGPCETPTTTTPSSSKSHALVSSSAPRTASWRTERKFTSDPPFVTRHDGSKSVSNVAVTCLACCAWPKNDPWAYSQ